MTISADTSTRSSVICDGGSESVLAPSLQPCPEKPTFDQLCDEIQGLGFSNSEVATLMAMFKETADAIIDVKLGLSDYIGVDMTAHEVLDRIIPDLTASTEDSLHARLEQHFLPEGWVLVHDKHGYCSIQAIPQSELADMLSNLGYYGDDGDIGYDVDDG
jgi:hypothetical protein